ncbi:hypothetical protein [Ekhidna sp.]
MIIFHHIYQVNHWKEISVEQKHLIDEIPEHSYIKHYAKEGDVGYELPTLQLLWERCESLKENTPICYVHTKGVTTPKAKNRRLWRETLNYWNLRRWKDNLSLLKEFDTSGARAFNFQVNDIALPHYSGNFWWANSDYIKKLESPENYIENFGVSYNPDNSDPKRFGCEFWIGSGNPRMGVVDNYPIKRLRQVTRFKGLKSFERLKRKFE